MWPTWCQKVRPNRYCKSHILARQPIEVAPFEGATPLALLARTRIAVIRETIRFIVRQRLKMSMST
jgi:hypothetical protein